MPEQLAINSTVKLSTGCTIPLLGFGVYANDTPGMLEALKAGYRHIDTAQLYDNEEQVGEALRQSGIPREEIFVTSKVFNTNHGYESTKKGIDESLAKLKTNYIDLFLVHDPTSGSEKRLETYKAMIEAKAAGKIRTIGVSNYNPKQIEEIRAQGWEMPAVNQVELHPFCQQKAIVEYCRKNNIVVEAYCPIIRGNMGHPVIKEIAAKYERDPAQILIRWSLQSGFIPLPKSSTPSRIRSNADVYNFELADEDMERLNALDKGPEGAISWNPVNRE